MRSTRPRAGRSSPTWSRSGASAIGLHNFVTGLIYLSASLMAGALWLVHPAGTFLFAAGLALAALVVFLRLRPDRPQR